VNRRFLTALQDTLDLRLSARILQYITNFLSYLAGCGTPAVYTFCLIVINRRAGQTPPFSLYHTATTGSWTRHYAKTLLRLLWFPGILTFLPPTSDSPTWDIQPLRPRFPVSAVPVGVADNRRGGVFWHAYFLQVPRLSCRLTTPCWISGWDRRAPTQPLAAWRWVGWARAAGPLSTHTVVGRHLPLPPTYLPPQYHILTSHFHAAALLPNLPLPGIRFHYPSAPTYTYRAPYAAHPTFLPTPVGLLLLTGAAWHARYRHYHYVKHCRFYTAAYAPTPLPYRHGSACCRRFLYLPARAAGAARCQRRADPAACRDSPYHGLPYCSDLHAILHSRQHSAWTFVRCLPGPGWLHPGQRGGGRPPWASTCISDDFVFRLVCLQQHHTLPTSAPHRTRNLPNHRRQTLPCRLPGLGLPRQRYYHRGSCRLLHTWLPTLHRRPDTCHSSRRSAAYLLPTLPTTCLLPYAIYLAYHTLAVAWTLRQRTTPRQHRERVLCSAAFYVPPLEVTRLRAPAGAASHTALYRKHLSGNHTTVGRASWCVVSWLLFDVTCCFSLPRTTLYVRVLWRGHACMVRRTHAHAWTWASRLALWTRRLTHHDTWAHCALGS